MSIALTIAGSDSGGGASIQADLKTFAAFGVYGCSAITAVTAQNTVGVTNIFEIPNQVIEDQIFAVMDDIVPNAIKIGLLSKLAIIYSVAQCPLRVVAQSPSLYSCIISPFCSYILTHRLRDMFLRHLQKPPNTHTIYL